MIVYGKVSKNFGAQVALHEMDLTIGEGEVVALLGPNGSGKTTALKVAAGLVRPTAGRVLINGIDSAVPAARRDVSYLPQRASFAESLTGEEVVEFYRRLRGVDRARTDEVLRMAALNGARNRAVGTYSGGMLQRLALAVSAVAGASMFLLDEPTASLDPDGLAAFDALARERRSRGGTIFFSSHLLGEAEHLADRFAILVGGKLVADFTRDELTQRLAARGSLRVRVDGRDEIIRATAEERPAILEAMRVEGRRIESITTEEGRLDDLYADLVAGKETA